MAQYLDTLFIFVTLILQLQICGIARLVVAEVLLGG